MAKIPIKKVKETFNERAKNITDKIFIADTDIDFLDYVQLEYEASLSTSQKDILKEIKKEILRSFVSSWVLELG